MKIRWQRRQDEVLFDDPRRAKRELGHATAVNFRKCVQSVVETPDFRTLLIRKPMGLHRLRHSRRKQWAFRLKSGLRLVVQPDRTHSVTIIVEIVDYHT